MILAKNFNKVCYAFSKGSVKINGRIKHAAPLIEYSCDKCGKFVCERYSVFSKRLALINLEYCSKCSKKLVSSACGKRGAYDENGNLKPNSGRFTRERVDALTEDEYKIYCEQRRLAAVNFHKKLNENPDLKEEYFNKIFQNSKIGYISKGQRELFKILEQFGFKLEFTFEGFRCDIVHTEKRVVIEYYGDYWHANPRIYSPETYIKSIKMTAEEKWNCDRKRNFALRQKNVTVIIIWELEWKNEKEKVLNKLKDFIDADFIFEEYKPPETKSKWINNGVKNKIVKNEVLNEYLNNGWKLGYYEIKKN